MADVYFEIADAAISKFGRKYFVSHDADSNAVIRSSPLSYLQYSERAWMEQDDKVWFIKNRHLPSPTVDLKEFMWIKLSAETVRG